MERWLIESRLDTTILRPSCFMEVWLSPAVGFDPVNGKVTIYGSGERPISWIAAGDVAAFAVAALSAPTGHNATWELGGPRPIPPLETVKIFEAALRRPLEVTHVPEASLDERVSAATDPMQRSFAALMRCVADGDAIEMGRIRELIPRPLTTVEAFAAQSVPAVTSA